MRRVLSTRVSHGLLAGVRKPPIAQARSAALLCSLLLTFFVFDRVGAERAAGQIPSLLLLTGSVHEHILSGATLTKAERGLVHQLPIVQSKQFAPGVTAPEQGPLRFLNLTGQLLPAGTRVPVGGVRLLAVAPGQTALRLQSGLFEVSVVKLELVSEREHGPQIRSRLSLSRTLPRELTLASDDAEPDHEGVSLRLQGPEQALPSVLSVTSFSAADRYLDALRDIGLSSAPCETAEFVCATTPELRLVVDSIERNHQQVKSRSVVAEVGGRVEVRLSDGAHHRFNVAAPDGLEAAGVGSPGRYKMRIAARLVNMQAGGPPPVGADAQEAIRIVQDELDVASRVWGQCGMVLGPREQWDIKIVDPPNITLLEVGCHGAQRASGGMLQLKLDNKTLVLNTVAGEAPRQVTLRLGQMLQNAGYVTAIYRNAQVRQAALPTYDIVVSDHRGRPISTLLTSGQPISNDPTLSVCVGELDLGDGLDHFSDQNAAAGTLEERMLLRGLDEPDPQTIELIIVPLFSGIGRIGESFIHSPGGSLKNAIILDRGGVRAGSRSLTLAHELGHILLAMPGHPDDFGVDTPMSLMDADAADATIFGPRRLSLQDCQRALRQSGPGSSEPLLEAWPLD